jgi:adenylate kinase family enzyme
MIIVEGFDGSGKTTLATRIGELLSWEVLHTGGPTRDEADVISCLLRSRQRMRHRCVQDRITHISESCYSLLSHPDKAARALDNLRDIHPQMTVIYCRPSTDFLVQEMSAHVRKEWDSDDHMSMVVANARQIIATYDAIMAVVALRVDILRYDRTVPDDSDRILKIVERRFR